jgi:TATA-box binding protein (TBP) (component of TFIID and TFIIIB)
MSNISNVNASLDDEWMQYLEDGQADDFENCVQIDSINEDSKVNDARELITSQSTKLTDACNPFIDQNLKTNVHAPNASNIRISTKTIIAYLNKTIDIEYIFWIIKIMPFHTPSCGIIKKQIKLDLADETEYNLVQHKLKTEPHTIKTLEHTTHKKNTTDFNGKIKINVGISKKNIIKSNTKPSGAFLNCIVLIYRLKLNGKFYESHIKVFNTGKIVIPGVCSNAAINQSLDAIRELLSGHIPGGVSYSNNRITTVLINSDFDCGYFIDRDKLNNILKYKYKIRTKYTPWYPGVQCNFYYDSSYKSHQTGIHNSIRQKCDYNLLDLNNASPSQKEIRKLKLRPNTRATKRARQTKIESTTDCSVDDIVETQLKFSNETEQFFKISFMIFRTGKILIVGKCEDNVILSVYEFLKLVLNHEYDNIHQPTTIDKSRKTLKKKSRKQTIQLSLSQFETNCK